MLNARDILGVTITDESEDKISEYVFDAIKSGKKKLFITTPNPEILVYANHHLDYKDKLNRADVSLPDGIGLVVASAFLGKSVKTRIAGVDFMEKLCKDSEKNPVSMGFLGGKHGVAEKTALCLQKKYPWIKVGFIGEEWGVANLSDPQLGGEQKRASPPAREARQGRTDDDVSPHFTPAPIDILFVAYGAPKQEEWISENLERLPIKAAMGVGGAFDYLSGRVPRAPKILRMVGLEWLFRLIIQPWRIWRQLSLIAFIYLVCKEF